jgi:hypothetical protein
MSLPLATIVWFDPGATTGITVLSLDARWLAGGGAATWEGLGRAVKHRWFAQVGTDARTWDDDAGKAKPVADLMRVVQGSSDETFEHLEGYPEYHRLALAIDQCADVLLQHPRAAWGHERFQLRIMAADLTPVAVIAALTHAELRYGPGRVPYMQTASQAKTTATDERLKQAGLYRAGMPHAVDSTRHAALFARKARSDAWLRAEAWPSLFKQ